METPTLGLESYKMLELLSSLGNMITKLQLCLQILIGCKS